jgi:hypothetical protein
MHIGYFWHGYCIYIEDEMLNKQQVQGVINEKGYIQNIGQIDAETKKALNKATKRGFLVKSRVPWLGCYYPLKTTWTLSKGGL